MISETPCAAAEIEIALGTLGVFSAAHVQRNHDVPQSAHSAVRRSGEDMPVPGLVVSDIASNFEHGNEAGI
jgi:hypothetical protein